MNTFFDKNNLSRAIVLPIIVIIICTLFGAIYNGNHTLSEEEDGLLLRAQNIAISVDNTNVANLEGNENDLNNINYQILKQKFMKIRDINTDSHFVYLMGMRDGQQFFYLDSEEPTSKDYSPPGQIYTDALPVDIENFNAGNPYVNGPYKDAWGTWISAYAPILSSDGQVLAMVGIDVNAKDILNHVLWARLWIIIIGILILTSLILIIRMVNSSKKYMKDLEDANTNLTSSKQFLKDVEDLAELGQMHWNMVSNEIELNDFMVKMIGANTKNITYSEFTKKIFQDDADKLYNDLQIIKKNDAEKLKFTFRVKDNIDNVKTIATVCKIKRDTKRVPMRMTCSAEDVTEHVK